MGLPKTQLQKRDRYGLLVATELAAEMLGDYERARTGAREIRVEAITETVWDDVVVHGPTHLDKWQVKRQLTPLSVAEAKKMIKALAPSAAPGAAPSRHYIGFAALVPIGKAKVPPLDLQKLAELCDSARVPNIDIGGFVQLHKNDDAFKFVHDALLPASSETAVIALGKLFVRALGTEHVVRARAIAHLEDLFVNADEVVTQLHNWLLHHSDGLIRIDSNVLHEQVIDQHAKRDINRSRWVHLSRNDVTSRWEARGPVAFASVVESAWAGSGRVRVQVGSEPFLREEALAPLARLLIHRAPGSTAEAAHGSDWGNAANGLCGSTLGVASQGLPLSCSVAPTVHPHPPRSDQTVTEFAVGLTSAMDEHVWKELVAAVPKLLYADRLAEDVRSATLALWARWLLELKTPAHRANLCRSMLATAEESTRSGMDASVRSGPLLVNDLARAVEIALVMGVGLEAGGKTVAILPDGRPQNLLIENVRAHLIAVTIASHPRDRQPCRLAADPTEMLADETGIAILAGVDANAMELYGIACDAAVSFHASDASNSNLKHRGSPAPFLTASPGLMRAMNLSLNAVRQHVVDQLQQMAIHRANELRQAIAGGTNG